MAVITAVETTGSRKTSWHFFDRAARLVFGRAAPRSGGGLGVYVAHPKFQFGPLSIVTAEALRVGSFGHGALAAGIVMGAMAPLILWFVLDATRLAHPSGPVAVPRTGHEELRQVRGSTAGGLGLLPAVTGALLLPLVWGYLSVYSLHLDDALAITLAVAAMWGVAKRSEVVVGLGLGLAMAAKPWAAAFLPLVLALPPGRRVRAGVIAVGTCAALWSPFVLGATGTTAALGHFTIKNAPDSALRAFGVHNPFTPNWDRAAQVVVGGAAGVWCARSGRWPAVLMAAAAVRLAIDPGTHRYYVAGIVAFVLVWEVISARWSLPAVTAATALALLEPHDLHWRAAVSGDIRLFACLVVLGLALVVKGPTTRSGDTRRHEPRLLHGDTDIDRELVGR